MKEISAMKLDVLNYIADIGAGNAAEALSNTLNKKISIVIDNVKYTKVESVPEQIGGTKEIAIGTYFRIKGSLAGDSLILFREETAYKLTSLLTGSGNITALDETGESVIKEVGNTLKISYLNAMADFLELNIVPSTPHICKDMTGGLLNQILAMQSQHSDNILVIPVSFYVESEKLKSHLLIILDSESMKKTIGIINKKAC